ncbi:LEA type 2 family protein [Brachyspira sp.]|uniref:NDR1/HIN1-like protein n=1 Tax=Brachyspira sp. TaxID=1977261 RepID=UPI00261A919D|nr:LEA type 2 family protein [Brachyspira sp.]
MIKKIIALISISIIMIVVTSCETLQSSAIKITRNYIEQHKPDIKIKKASISNITFKDITLTTLLEVKNNLDFEIPVDKLKIDLINTSGKTFTTAESVETLKIPANQARDINVNFKAKYVDIFTTAFDAIKTKSFKCKAKITLTFTVYGMRFEFPYTKELTFKE